jgi:hypothetical protein
MSVLNLPRLNFSGQALWNPNTVNNSPFVYNENLLQPNPDIPPATFGDWIKSLNNVPPPNQNLNGSWNVYGDGSCWFRGATIGGVQLAYGETTTDDAICGAELQIVGQSFQQNPGNPPPCRMVDVAPYQSSTTQFFVKWLQLGTSKAGLKAAVASRMFLRWSMLRNTDFAHLPIAGPAGVILQTSARAADIEWYGVESSPALQALQKAANASPNQGIVIQLALYLVQYYKNATFNGQPITSAQELAAAYANGFTGGNPAQTEITGTIGVWGPNELATAPTQIILNPVAAVPPLASPSLPAARAVMEGMVPAPPPPPPQPQQLGPAIASLDAGASNLAVSFITTVWETDLNLTKADLGPLQLQAVDGGGTVTTLATIPYSSAENKGYDKASYRQSSGILDFALTPAQVTLLQAAGTSLQLNVPDAAANGVVALQQLPLVCETDQRGVYLDEGETQTITVAVYENGAPAGDNVLVCVNQYYEAPYDTSQAFPYYLVTPANQGQACLNLGPSGTPNQIVLPVTNGTVSFSITSVSPGSAMLGFQPFLAGSAPPAPLPGGPGNFPGTGTTTFYAVVRCLGFDNQMLAIPDDQVNWTNTYNMVLQPYNLVYPIMSLIIDLADENAVNAAAGRILAVTEYPQNFMWTLFMPVTREMSAGKRSLLRRYCTKVLAGGS